MLTVILAGLLGLASVAPPAPAFQEKVLHLQVAVASLLYPLFGARLLPPDARLARLDLTNPRAHRLLFDDDTRTCATWTVCVPQDYRGTPRLKVVYAMTTATTGEVVLGVNEDGFAQQRSFAFCRQTVPGTTGHMSEIECPFADDAPFTPLHRTTIYLCRDKSQETAIGDMAVYAVTWHYQGLAHFTPDPKAQCRN